MALLLWCMCPPVLMSCPSGASSPNAVTNRSTFRVLGYICTLDVMSSKPVLRIYAQHTCELHSSGQ